MLLRPTAGYDPAPFDAGRLDRVDPGEFPDSVDRGGHQHTAVQAGTAWTEVLHAVDGRQAGLCGSSKVSSSPYTAPQAPTVVLSETGRGRHCPDRRACVPTSARGCAFYLFIRAHRT